MPASDAKTKQTSRRLQDGERQFSAGTARHRALPVRECALFSSYPRSGSNWIRAMLTAAIDPTRNYKDLIVSDKPGSEAPNIRFQGLEMPMLKTHKSVRAFGQLADNVRGVLTIYRHPIDVCLSSLNYLHHVGNHRYFRDGVSRPLTDIIADGDLDYYLDRFADEDGISAFAGQSGPFSEYHRAMKEYACDHNVLALRFEDVCVAPDKALVAVLDFMGLAANRDCSDILADASQITEAFTSFRRLPYTYRGVLSARQIAGFGRKYARALLDMDYDV